MKFRVTSPLLALMLAVSSGCSSDSHAIEAPEYESASPTSFEEAGATWSKVDDMAEADTERLTAYFRDNPSVSENPLIEGDPLVYRNGRSRRYYWVRAGMGGAEWSCLEFGGRNVEMLTGSGEPFHSDSASP